MDISVLWAIVLGSIGTIAGLAILILMPFERKLQKKKKAIQLHEHRNRVDSW